MSGFGGNGAFCRFARLLALGGGCLALANCSGGMSGKVDPKYGVAASGRAVEPGEPVPKGGGKYRVGRPYVVAGRVYIPEEDVNYSAIGMASWYGDDFHGRYTANGEIFDMNSLSAAHKTLPLPSYVRVTNLSNNRSIVVRVNDRGPYAADRVIDLSVKTAQVLGFYGRGLAKVKVDYVGRAPIAGSDDKKLMATLRDGKPDQDDAKPVQVAANKSYAPAFFDARPMAQAAAKPAADNRYQLASAGEDVPAAPPAKSAKRAPTTELAAATRPQPAQAVTRETLPPADTSVSPVSAYAPARYDQPAGFMSGRGLY